MKDNLFNIFKLCGFSVEFVRRQTNETVYKLDKTITL